MNTEDVLFKTFNEIVLLSELYTALSEEQVVTMIDTVNSWFSELPPDVIDRYKVFLRNSIDREKARGAYARASALDDHATALGLDKES
jgi:hypothetical protein